ncbi:MAG: bifunctional riboflavin kinase/FAD synthetase [Dehalococcoidales bacterium]|nr:MAG: bifunctional riboflavin kinase/FAD synthetase [Dehalococcoidales bacterium]
MQVDAELAELAPDKDMMLTIGVFDGVHLGHKYLISQLTGSTRQKRLLSGVVTFRQHPREILSPHNKPLYLTVLPEKVRLLKNEGVDAVIILSFTEELARLSASQFINLLQKHLRMRGLIIGPDFALGYNREGNSNYLRQLGQEHGFSVTVIPPITANGETVSSTAIRNALANGNIKKVINLMGHPLSLQGQIASGAGRGLELGFPTANIDVDPRQALPADGVYATWAHFDDSTHQSVTNIGRRPTFDGHERTVETYVIDYRGDLYGRQMRIDIVERLRNEKRFDNVEDLKKQMAEDVKQGIAILDSQNMDKLVASE